MHEWNEAGYDVSRADRWLYAFATEDCQLVKVGLVLSEQRLTPRLREVRRRSGRPDLFQLWVGSLPDLTGEEAEHVESAVRHWLTGVAGFGFVGRVDWLRTPEGFVREDAPRHFDRAVLAAISFGR